MREHWQTVVLLAMAAFVALALIVALVSDAVSCGDDCPPFTRGMFVKSWPSGIPECVCVQRGKP